MKKKKGSRVSGRNKVVCLFFLEFTWFEEEGLEKTKCVPQLDPSEKDF